MKLKDKNYSVEKVSSNREPIEMSPQKGKRKREDNGQTTSKKEKASSKANASRENDR